MEFFFTVHEISAPGYGDVDRLYNLELFTEEEGVGGIRTTLYKRNRFGLGKPVILF